MSPEDIEALNNGRQEIARELPGGVQPLPAAPPGNAAVRSMQSLQAALQNQRVALPHNPAPGTLKDGDRFTADSWWWHAQNAKITADPIGMANALAAAGREERRCSVCDAIGLCWGFGDADLCPPCLETAKRKEPRALVAADRQIPSAIKDARHVTCLPGIAPEDTPDALPDEFRLPDFWACRCCGKHCDRTAQERIAGNAWHHRDEQEPHVCTDCLASLPKQPWWLPIAKFLVR